MCFKKFKGKTRRREESFSLSASRGSRVDTILLALPRVAKLR